ncbi:CMRF35-like molecule 8 isoform X2 [Hoplias malabaricus]|uniref:CMRF35-like molecule 8 isoform X2 n=1 Tax=Hoplias malabaricus TaxID=27720 RepID=UPI00346307C8
MKQRLLFKVLNVFFNMDIAEMTMKILFIFSLYLISAAGGSRRVRGFSGGGVLIKCRYEKKYTSNTKYFCKSSVSNCVDQIKTDVKNKSVKSGRFSLFDDTSAAVFWVMITNLTVEDSGLYQCAVDKTLLWDCFTPVELKVEEAQDFGKSISVTGRSEGNVNISCKYPQSLLSYPKFLCRRVDSGGCVYKTPVKESRKLINQGKYSLRDDRVENTLSVIISDVREGDSGEYWCGAESDWESDHGYKLYITHINLTVTEQKPPAETSTPTTIPQATTTSTNPTTQDSTSMKTSAGADVQLSVPNSSETTEPATSSASNNKLSSLSGHGFPSSTEISVMAVVVALLLVGLVLFILALQKRRKSQDLSSPTKSPRSTLDGHKVTLAKVNYEAIKDSGVSTIYSTADLFTHSSDPSQALYYNVQLPTSPCNISNPIYSTAELPTSLSDSGEDLNYSTVYFNRKSDGFVMTATANKEQDSCEYATVRN